MMNKFLEEFMAAFKYEGLTFDDVSLVTQYADFLPFETSVESRFSRNVKLNIPFASAAMDTVTEGAMAIAMAMHDRAALVGDPAAARYVAEYTEGKPADKVEIGGMDGKPIEAIDLTKMTDEQLQRLIAARKNS